MLDLKFGMQWQYGEKRGSFTLIHRPFVEGIKDFSPAFTLIAEDVLQPHVIGQFRTEGRADLGDKWQDLAPSTLRGRPNTPILFVTGALENSFMAGGANHVQDITPLKLVWGSKDPKALFHQFGTGSRVDFKRAGARKVIAKTAAALTRYRERLGMGHGVPARPMFVYTRFLANEITSKILGRVAQVARACGYQVGSRMFGGLNPVEARQIGEALLRNA
jgi:hypothetical protein